MDISFVIEQMKKIKQEQKKVSERLNFWDGLQNQLEEKTEKITVVEAKKIFLEVFKAFLEKEDKNNPSHYLTDFCRIMAIAEDDTKKKIFNRLLKKVRHSKEWLKINHRTFDKKGWLNDKETVIEILEAYLSSEIIQIKRDLWKSKIELPSISKTREQIKKIGIPKIGEIKTLIG